MSGRGLPPPSTTLPPPAPPVVDGRHKAGHDTMGTPSHDLNAYAAQAGPETMGTPSHDLNRLCGAGRPSTSLPHPALQAVDGGPLPTMTRKGWPHEGIP